MTKEQPAEDNPTSGDDIEIRDPEIDQTDVAAIMQRIRDRIRERSERAEANGQRYALPEGISAATFEPGHGQPSGMQLTLERLRGAASGVFVHLSVVEKKPLPLVGPALLRIRGAIHQLVLYYVGALAARQATFNRASLDAFQQLTFELAQANKRIELLEQELKSAQSNRSASNPAENQTGNPPNNSNRQQ